MDQAAEIIDISSPAKASIVEAPTPYKNSKRAKLFFRTHNAIQNYEVPFLILILGFAVCLGMLLFSRPLQPSEVSIIARFEDKSFWTFLTEYTSLNGLLHPFGYLINLSFLYFAKLSLQAANIALFTVHALNATLLGLLFAKKYTRVESALVALLYLAFPYLTNSYSSFMQANLAFAALILILQLTIIQSDHLDFLVKGVFVTILQLVGVLVHEQLLFTFIPLLFILMPYDKGLLSGQQLRTMVLTSVPTVLYLFIKIFALPPKDVSIISIYGIDAFKQALAVISRLFQPVQFSTYWLQQWLTGITTLQANTVFVIGITLLLFVLAYELFLFFTYRLPHSQSGPPLIHPVFWVLLGITALIPFSPNTMGIALFSLSLAGILACRIISKRVTLLVMIVLLCLFFPVSVGLLMQ